MNNTSVTDQAATAAPVDWAAADVLALRCGPRTRRLVWTRNVEELAAWLPLAVRSTYRRSPREAARYACLAVLVGLASPPAGDVDHQGVVVPFPGAA
jgi:hypothetical protein